MWSQEGMKRCYLGEWVRKSLYLSALQKQMKLENKLSKYETKCGET